MKTTEIFMKERTIIENLKNMLEVSSQKMNDGKDVPPWMLRENIELLQIYTDVSHKNREELIVSHITGLGQKLTKRESTEDYDLLKKYERFLLYVIEAYDLGYNGAKTVFARYSKDYISLIKKHMEFETELFGRSEDHLKDLDAKLLKEFKRIRGVPRKMRERAHIRIRTLEREYQKVAA